MLGDHINTNLFLEINRFAQRTDWLHGPMKAVAGYGIAAFGVLLIAGWLWARRQTVSKLAALVWTGLGTLAAVAINQPIVHYFHESRPYTSLQHILVLTPRTTDYGFPSDHATMAGAVTAGLFLVHPLLGLASLTLALVMAFSRVYIAAHYPYDVLAGLVLGAAVVLAGYIILRRPLILIVTKLAGTPLRPLITDKPANSQN